VQHGRHNLPRVDDLFGGRAGVPQRHACVAGLLAIDHGRIEVVRHDGRDDRLLARCGVGRAVALRMLLISVLMIVWIVFGGP
jgi:hypothetical protein